MIAILESAIRVTPAGFFMVHYCLCSSNLAERAAFNRVVVGSFPIRYNSIRSRYDIYGSDKVNQAREKNLKPILVNRPTNVSNRYFVIKIL